MATATYVLELATGAGANPGAWTDITAYLQSITWRRGRDDVLQQVSPAYAELVLNNSDGRFSPALTTSPIYGQVKSWRAMRLRATAPVAANLYFGYIISAKPDPRPEAQTCAIRLVDGFGWLSRVKTTPSYTNDRSDVEIGLALDSASWPAALRTLDTGISTFTPAYTLQDVSSQLNGIGVDNEGGLVYFDGAGHCVFESRHYRTLTTRCTTSQGTFADTSTKALAVRDLAAERQATDVGNRVTITYTGGASTTVDDAASQTEFGISLVELTASFLGATEASSRAQWLLSQRKDEHDRPVVVLQGNRSTAMLTHVLSRILSDRVTILDSSGRTGVNADFHIEAVTLQIMFAGAFHAVQWQLSPVDPYQYWIIGYGQVGTMRIGY